MSATAADLAAFILECTNTALATLQVTIAEELHARLIAERSAPPTEGGEMLSLLFKGRLMPKADTPARLRRSSRPPTKGKAALRVVRPDQRPKQMQWNEANKSWG